MSAPQNADRYLTKRWTYADPATDTEIYYVRPGGDDNNDGRTELTAFATLERALHFMAIAAVNVAVIIDITGMTVSAASVLNIGGTTLGGVNFDIDLTATSPNNFYSRAHRQIRAEPQLVQALNVTGSVTNPTSGITTLTVTDALVANALKGTIAIGANLGEYGTIRSNSGGAGPNTVEVCNISGINAPVGAYGPGATLNFGVGANPFEQAIYLLALCDWTLQGLRITSNGPKPCAVTVLGAAPVTFLFCDIDGIQIENRAPTFIDACYVHNGTFAQDGGGVRGSQSYFDGLNYLCHGSGADGLTEFIACCFDASLTPFGGGNVESAYNFSIENCEFDSAVTVAVQAIGNVSRLNNVVVSNSGSSGIVAQDGVTLTLSNVQGTTNANYGLEAYYGAIVKRTNGTGVSGGINDIFVGGIGAAAWTDIPIAGGDQLVSVGA